MSIQAYQKMANKTADPRDIEFRLFAEVTRELLDVQKCEKHEVKKIMAALDKNRRVWSAMAMDCAQPGNQLPEATRAGIISLSMFVGRHTSECAKNLEEIDTLVEINRNIMQGLSARAGMTPEEAEAAIAAA